MCSVRNYTLQLGNLYIPLIQINEIMKLGLRSRIKRVSIEDVLQILIVATAVLVVITIFDRNLTIPAWGVGGIPPWQAFFDIFVRYGIFNFTYFTLIPVFILWVAKTRLKKRWNPRNGGFLLIISLAVLTTIFFVMPGAIYGNPLNLPWPEYAPSISPLKEVYEIEHEFCGKRLDFFYRPTCGVDKLTPELETIKNQLEASGSDTEFYVWCASENETLCEDYQNGKYTLEDVADLSKEYNLKSLPSLVIGCKYVARGGGFGLEEWKELLCEKINECDL